jgi:hypothetical protein
MLFQLIKWLSIVCIIGCQPKNKIYYRLEVANELQGCEEQNIHFTIKKAINEVDQEIEHSLEGTAIFVSVDEKVPKELATQIYSKLWPEWTTRRTLFTIKGYFNGRKTAKVSPYYGCYGSPIFVMENILHETDVTKKYDYPIHYEN